MINNFKNTYFIGIGGIGMSSLAMYFYKLGYSVAGYDLVNNKNCKNLESYGIKIIYDEDCRKIDKDFYDVQNSLIIYTPAIPQNNEILKYFINNGYKVIKRAEALGQISRLKKTLAISGTHGKTSVTSLCAWIMSNSKLKCSAFIGGISKNYSSNFVLDKSSDYMVVEADEFDRSFLKITPFISLITCIEKDHLDIYKNYDNLLDSFLDFLNLTNSQGKIVLNNSIDKKILNRINSKAQIYWYGLDANNSDFYIENIQKQEGKYKFDFVHPKGKIYNIISEIGGGYNWENIVASISVSILCGVYEAEIKKAVNSYSGVERRFDIIIQNENIVFIDDYAHHPDEISATICAIKEMYPQKKICLIFQPHLYSRTKDFFKEFANSLSKVDSLFLLPIYPAREKPIKGISSKLIYDLCECNKKVLCEKEEVIDLAIKEKPEILVTMGAGNIECLVKPLKLKLEKNEK